MLKIKRGKGTRRCFSEIPESRHSPLVLVGAPAQGYSEVVLTCREPEAGAELRSAALWLRRSAVRSWMFSYGPLQNLQPTLLGRPSRSPSALGQAGCLRSDEN